MQQDAADATDAAPSFRIVNGRLRASLELLDGFDASNRFVPALAAKSILLDIGINTLPTPPPWAPGLSGNHSHKSWFVRHNSTLYLGFEPLLDKYAMQISRSLHPLSVERTDLGHVHIPWPGTHSIDRWAYMLPLAVADNGNRPATFFVADVDGCSSMQRQRAVDELSGWNETQIARNVRKGCGGTRESRRVPTVTLATVLGEWLDGKTVQFMHIDVQGVSRRPPGFGLRPSPVPFRISVLYNLPAVRCHEPLLRPATCQPLPASLLRVGCDSTLSACVCVCLPTPHGDLL